MTALASLPWFIFNPCGSFFLQVLDAPSGRTPRVTARFFSRAGTTSRLRLALGLSPTMWSPLRSCATAGRIVPRSARDAIGNQTRREPARGLRAARTRRDQVTDAMRPRRGFGARQNDWSASIPLLKRDAKQAGRSGILVRIEVGVPGIIEVELFHIGIVHRGKQGLQVGWDDVVALLHDASAPVRSLHRNLPSCARTGANRSLVAPCDARAPRRRRDHGRLGGVGRIFLS